MGTTGFSELFIIGEVQQGVDLSISRGSEGFSCGSVGKESACNTGDLGSIPGLGRSPGERKGYPLQYFGLENSMDKEWDTTEQLSLSCTGEGNGNPLQCSCLENPRGGRA